jgi:hypothetical protein
MCRCLTESLLVYAAAQVDLTTRCATEYTLHLQLCTYSRDVGALYQRAKRMGLRERSDPLQIFVASTVK